MRASLACLRRQVACALRNLPPVGIVVDLREGDSEDAYRAKREAAQREAAKVAASGRRAFLLIVDREEGDS